MITTYQEFFNAAKEASNETEEKDYYECEDKFIRTPSGYSKINGVLKKNGIGLKLTLEDGKTITAEERHTVSTSKGWKFVCDAEDVEHETGKFIKVISKTQTSDTVFYDVCIDYPHAYFDTNGFVHHNTFTMMQVVKEVGLTKGVDYVKLSGKATPTEIYKTLFMFRNGGMVIFDDLDSMWGNEDATNILKAALDSSKVREISWQSANTINVSKMGDDEREELFTKIDKQIEENPVKVRYPSSFEFTGRVIFISNLKKEDFDSAILSRSAKIGMDLTPEQVLMRLKSLLPTLGGEDVSMSKKEELLDHLVHMNTTGEIDMVTMREFVKGLDIVRSGAPNWKDLLSYA